jgi:hypothetical protein
MISLNCQCDECRGSISDGDAAYCIGCWNTAQVELDKFQAIIDERDDEIADLKQQLVETALAKLERP